MKRKTLAVIALIGLMLLPGCVTKQQDNKPLPSIPWLPPAQPVAQTNIVVPPLPATTGSNAYVVDPRINQVIDTLKTVNASTAAVNPYAPITGFALDGVLALATGIAGLLAASKNKQAKQQAAAADSLAQVVVAKNLQNDALIAAAENQAPLVQQHLDNNTSTVK